MERSSYTDLCQLHKMLFQNSQITCWKILTNCTGNIVRIKRSLGCWVFFFPSYRLWFTSYCVVFLANIDPRNAKLRISSSSNFSDLKILNWLFLISGYLINVRVLILMLILVYGFLRIFNFYQLFEMNTGIIYKFLYVCNT